MKIVFSGTVRLANVVIKNEMPVGEYLIALEAPENQEPDFLLNEDGSTPVILTHE